MVPALTQPTRSYIDGTPTQRRLGFVAASIFSATYVIAPVYLLITGVTAQLAKQQRIQGRKCGVGSRRRWVVG